MSVACEILVPVRFEGALVRQRWKLSFLLSASLWSSAHVVAQTDSSPHKVQLVTVEQGVQLEVLDWGGSGRPLIFLAGAGDTAHRFDGFAPQFTNQHHVYCITRRGSGASSQPAPANGNYSADHLGDDVLAVMKALHIDRPVLVGHSIAGQELSSIGSRFPEKVSGLIYLDAATGFAFYDPTHPPIAIEMNDIKRRIDEIEAGGVDEQKKLLELETAVAGFETVLHQSNAEIANLPPLPPRSPIGAALNFGAQKYTNIPVPVLAIYACPHNWDRFPANQPDRKAALLADDKARCTAWADAFSHGVPGGRIVLIPNADHYLYLSNEAQVVAEMNAFLARLH
jgi:non-heme chloroperoxidase